MSVCVCVCLVTFECAKNQFFHFIDKVFFTVKLFKTNFSFNFLLHNTKTNSIDRLNK